MFFYPFHPNRKTDSFTSASFVFSNAPRSVQNKKVLRIEEIIVAFYTTDQTRKFKK